MIKCDFCPYYRDDRCFFKDRVNCNEDILRACKCAIKLMIKASKKS